MSGYAVTSRDYLDEMIQITHGGNIQISMAIFAILRSEPEGDSLLTVFPCNQSSTLGCGAIEIISCYKVNQVLNYMSQALVRYMVQDRLIS